MLSPATACSSKSLQYFNFKFLLFFFIFFASEAVIFEFKLQIRSSEGILETRTDKSKC